MSLKVSHIAKSFGNNEVLSDVSLELPESHIAILMGTNGAGKTTLLNIMSGFMKPERGKISINDYQITLDSPCRFHKLGVGRTFQDMRLIGNMTVFENVMLAFPMQEGEKWWKTFLPNKKVKMEQEKNCHKANEILSLCFINDVAQNKASEISYGEQKLLNLACCMASGTSIWLLDEPVAGVNPVYREKLSEIIKQQKKKGKSLLIIEHSSDFITEVADEILFLNKGIVKSYPSYDIFKKDSNVKNAYV